MARDDAAVVVETEGRKLFVRLNRPGAMNAQNEEMRDLLVAAIDRLETDRELLVGIVHGLGGRAFSAGADLKERPDRAPTGRFVPEHSRPAWRHFEAFRWASKPLIAAIDGYCLGGGLELANYCDIRIATDASRFGQPEPRTVGGTAGPALHQLPRTLPPGEALLMQLTSQPMSAARAYQLGLVQRLCPDPETLMAEATAIADEMIECNPTALRTIKRVVRWGADMSAEQAEMLAQLASESGAQALEPDDWKRPPR
jgi:enoyl-CoA hydratase/carnithine racemase